MSRDREWRTYTGWSDVHPDAHIYTGTDYSDQEDLLPPRCVCFDGRYGEFTESWCEACELNGVYTGKADERPVISRLDASFIQLRRAGGGLHWLTIWDGENTASFKLALSELSELVELTR